VTPAWMATNPQYQPPQKGPQLVPELQAPVKMQFPGPLVAIVAAAAILTALIVSLPSVPNQRARSIAAAQQPQQPTGIQVQLTDMKMVPAQVGSAFYIDGQLINSGGGDITGVQLQGAFKSASGQVLDTQTHPVNGLRSGGGMQDLSQAPIKPNEVRPVRIYYDHVPQGWNRQMPELKVTAVTSSKQ